MSDQQGQGGGLRNASGKISVKKILGVQGFQVFFAMAVMTMVPRDGAIPEVYVPVMIAVGVASVLLLGIKSAVGLIQGFLSSRFAVPPVESGEA